MQICEVGRGTRKISLRVAVDYLENAHITHHSETQQKIYKGYTKEIQTLCNTPHNNFYIANGNLRNGQALKKYTLRMVKDIRIIPTNLSSGYLILTL